ncbi:MAG TPA: signal recognition particle protein [Firmicutes bacterium]|nr:signal recognition particle protein [Bacillota bacterium]
MFDSLTAKLQEALRRLRGKGKLSEKDVDEALREVRLALLEADVNFKVVKDFISEIKQKAIGQEVLTSLTPAQQVVKIVLEGLTALMGGKEARIAFASTPPTVIMLVGLQGSGKTTTAAKLARMLKGQGRRPMMVACDTQRPAAITQLEVLGQRLDIPVFSMGDKVAPDKIAKAGLSRAADIAADVVIVDTAGRLHIDQELMDQLRDIRQSVTPHEVLLVVDAMTGQDAVNVAKAFNETIGIDGVILTKLDGDARGGAALSCRAVTGKPIKFVGVGEKLDALEPFYPDRMASRILGMGDIQSLIEKAEAAISVGEAQKLAQKMASREFSLEDFVEQLRQVRRMGPLDQLLAMIPGFGTSKALKDLKVDEKQLQRIEAIVCSMTPGERRNPSIIDGSRRRRIARGSGTSIQEVNSLLKQFEQVKRLMGQLGDMQKYGRRGIRLDIPYLR